MPERVLHLRLLDEKIVLGLQARRRHRALVEERQPFLDSLHSGPLSEVAEQRDIEHERCGENGVAAEEVDLDLHGIIHPSEDVDVVPAFLVVAARRIVVDPDDVREILVQIRILLRLKDRVQHRQLGLFLGLERLRIVEHFPVAVAEDVGRIPSSEAEHASLESWRDDGLHPRLARLEILAGYRNATLLRELEQRRNVSGKIRRAVRERYVFHDRCIRVQHRWSDRFVVVVHCTLELLDRRVLRTGLDEYLGRSTPDYHYAVELVLCLEITNVLTQLLREITLRLARLDVGPVDARHVMIVEYSRHRLDRRQKVRDRSNVLLFENPRLANGRQCVIRNRVPGTEHDVIQIRERNEVLD